MKYSLRNHITGAPDENTVENQLKALLNVF